MNCRLKPRFLRFTRKENEKEDKNQDEECIRIYLPVPLGPAWKEKTGKRKEKLQKKRDYKSDEFVHNKVPQVNNINKKKCSKGRNAIAKDAKENKN